MSTEKQLEEEHKAMVSFFEALRATPIENRPAVSAKFFNKFTPDERLSIFKSVCLISTRAQVESLDKEKEEALLNKIFEGKGVISQFITS